MQTYCQHRIQHLYVKRSLIPTVFTLTVLLFHKVLFTVHGSHKNVGKLEVLKTECQSRDTLFD